VAFNGGHRHSQLIGNFLVRRPACHSVRT
jgi:hypothetical protein